MTLTGTTYDFASIPVKCEKCGESTLHKIKELEHANSVECKVCRAEIDVSTAEWRERIEQDAYVSKRVFKL
ncbi:hypothetical protein ABNQ39_20465 [Azospirillum sp. A26]|uniref:hypothetical protein n=1 Tax=Azospirillum sp. A26 TaxID=3160607 RepID=UPI0036726470